MTDAERRLWFAMRDRRLAGYKFRRQHPIDALSSTLPALNITWSSKQTAVNMPTT
jgi:hypothetical protein